VQDLMKDWGVRSVPQFHFWKNGERVDQMTGSKPDALKTKIAEVAAACVAA
jgi:thioredoxin-like negative regulator of GroEL